MFDGLIVAMGYVISAALGITFVCGLLLAAARKWGPLKAQGCLSSVPLGCALPLLFLFIILVGCGWALRPVEQPESIKTVAAFEVPLPLESDRNEFLSVLDAAAKAEGMHMDSESSENLRQTADAIPQAKMTIHAAVWRGRDDDELIASVMDQSDHLGQVWILFHKGKDPQLASRFRVRAMSEIMQHWPNTLSLPIMPTGAIPLYQDLVRQPGGYVVNPSAAYKYTDKVRPK